MDVFKNICVKLHISCCTPSYLTRTLFERPSYHIICLETQSALSRAHNFNDMYNFVNVYEELYIHVFIGYILTFYTLLESACPIQQFPILKIWKGGSLGNVGHYIYFSLFSKSLVCLTFQVTFINMQAASAIWQQKLAYFYVMN